MNTLMAKLKELKELFSSRTAVQPTAFESGRCGCCEVEISDADDKPKAPGSNLNCCRSSHSKTQKIPTLNG